MPIIYACDECGYQLAEHDEYCLEHPDAIVNTVLSTTMHAEVKGGICETCEEPASWRECSVCGTADWIIDCGHFAQPRPIAPGRSNGQQMHRLYCTNCAQVDLDAYRAGEFMSAHSNRPIDIRTLPRT